MSALDVILSRIRGRGPLTVAEFMEIALYHPGEGYYARAAQRSGREGDFYTSVDVGPLFGEMVAVQIEEMSRLLDPDGMAPFDLVEAGAGNGRLSRDVLDAIADRFPAFYARLRLTLVEISPEARQAQRQALGRHADRLAGSRPDLPARLTGAVIANELLDALPVHVLEMTTEGLREVFVTERDGRLSDMLGEVSDPALPDWVDTHAGGRPAEGARFEAGLAATRWIQEAAASLDRGFLLLFDYGHEARELLSNVHAAGTLTAYRSHTADATDWLTDPGDVDLTSHVNLTAIRLAAESAGLVSAGLVDQTYFLIALGLAERLDAGEDLRAIRRRLAARTLIMPGGLGSTMKAMAFSKGAGAIALRGFSEGRLS